MRSYIKHFLIIIKLSYTHIMKQRMQKTIKILKFENIYFHTRLIKR